MIYTEAGAHNRSFSFSAWESKEHASKQRSNMYYNYKQKHDEGRNITQGDMPTFGDGLEPRVSSYYARNNYSQANQPHWQHKKQSSYEKPFRQNSSMDNFNNRQKIQVKAREQDSYITRMMTADTYSVNSMKIDGRVHTSTRNNRFDMERATQQKLSNIDKINEKIKKILNTLSQEEKKISMHHTRGTNKKMSNISYAQRIKTEGDESYDQNYQLSSNYMRQSRDIFNRMADYKTKVTQPESKVQKKALYEWSANNNLQSSQNMNSKLQQGKNNQSRYLNDYYTTNKQNAYPSSSLKNQLNQPWNKNMANLESSYKFLKGTNVKSTDSLNLSTSICPARVSEDKQNRNYSKVQPHQSASLKQVLVSKVEKKYEKCKTQDSFYKQWQVETGSKNQPQRTVHQQSANEHQIKYRHTFGSLDPEEEYENKYHKNRVDIAQRTPVKSKFLSQISRVQKSEKSCKLSNGKDLDAQIDKIQRKIEDYQNVKRSINLQDDETSKKSRESLSKSLSKYKLARFSMNQVLSNRIQKQRDTKPFQESQMQNKITPFMESSQRIQTGYDRLQNSKSQFEADKVHNLSNQDMEISLPKPFKMSSKRNTKRSAPMNSDIREIESAFISEDRNQIKSRSLKLLINSLCKQIQLDTEFRNAKKWFNKKVNLSKWNELSRQLGVCKIGTTDQQNKEIFTMTEQEDNPFHTERDDGCSYRDLVNSFINSEKHWIDYLQHKFVREEIEQSLSEMDIDRKGRVTIEDMVRYINLESDHYYRNRDLSLVFRRLSGAKGEVTLEYVLTEFCHQ